MAKISKEDCHSLELKIQTEIKKVFSQFIEDLENNTVEPENTITPPEPRKPGRPKRSITINKTSRSSHAGTNHPGSILESDMAKIFRKKHRRGSNLPDTISWGGHK